MTEPRFGKVYRWRPEEYGTPSMVIAEIRPGRWAIIDLEDGEADDGTSEAGHVWEETTSTLTDADIYQPEDDWP